MAVTEKEPLGQQWFPPTPHSLLLSPIMSRFPWSLKDVRGDRDVSDFYPSDPSPEVTRRGEWTTSRRELWCFYLYSIVSVSLFFINFFSILYYPPKGNNALAAFRFAPSQFQNLLYFAGYDPSQPPFAKPCGRGSSCVLPFMGHVRNSSVFSHLHTCVAHQWACLFCYG